MPTGSPLSRSSSDPLSTSETLHMDIQPDVRRDQYIGKCPGCGRVRLELFVDGPEDDKRCVGVQCEKCHRQWLFDPEKADFYGAHDDRNPLYPDRA